MTIGCSAYRRVARREFLRAGGAGLFGLSCASLLEAQTKPVAPKARQIIVLWLLGGPPHIDMFDMKPDAPEDIRGAWTPIQTRLPGLLTNELMPGLAGVADKLTILRSVNAVGYHGAPMAHTLEGTWPYLTGNKRGKEGTTPAYPSYANTKARLQPGPVDVPAYVSVQESGDSSPELRSYLGAASDPMPLRAGAANDHLAQMLAPPPSQLDLATLERRTDLLRALDQQLQHLDRSEPLIGGLDKYKQQAFALLRSPKLRQALDLKNEPEKSVARYGNSEWGRRTLAARRLVEAGVPCVFLNFNGWDFHGSTGKPNGTFDHASKCFAHFDALCSALLQDLDDRGLLDSTLVLSAGEMGRSPKPENTRGSRGHWDRAQHILVAGGGFQRGCIVGATDKHGGEIADKFYKVPSLARTVYHQLGIDPDQELQTPDGRPLKIVLDDGPLIHEAM
jgi:hypothetical protein